MVSSGKKIIKDLAHGFIEIDNSLSKVIDHRSFQRLKNISQLTAHHVFPSANHTRFEHSLGVMHLARKFLESLESQLKEHGVEEAELSYFRFHLKYSALLHDIGHAPFSHVGESFYDEKEIEDKLSHLFENGPYIANFSDWIKNGSRHEKMSCYVIGANFLSLLYDLAEKELVDKYDFDLEFIFRIITGSKYIDEGKWKSNLIIEILNSNSLDVDKLDYLIRDNLMVGYIAPSFNLDRLLRSVLIDSSNKLAFSSMGISSVVSIIDCRDFLYIWLYNHHIVVYTDFLYKTAIQHLSNEKNKKSSENKISMDDYFSCDAIANKMVADCDIMALLGREYLNKESKYSTRILSQLLDRKFLKPLWKTIFDYNSFIAEHFDDRQRKSIEEMVSKGEYHIKKLVKQLLKECCIDAGELFIIPRSNKFYAMNSKSDFYITLKGKDIELSKIIPERKFDEMHSNVAFYVFAPEDKLIAVEQNLVRLLKEYCSK